MQVYLHMRPVLTSSHTVLPAYDRARTKWRVPWRRHRCQHLQVRHCTHTFPDPMQSCNLCLKISTLLPMSHTQSSDIRLQPALSGHPHYPRTHYLLSQVVIVHPQVAPHLAEYSAPCDCGSFQPCCHASSTFQFTISALTRLQLSYGCLLWRVMHLPASNLRMPACLAPCVVFIKNGIEQFLALYLLHGASEEGPRQEGPAVQHSAPLTEHCKLCLLLLLSRSP